MKINELISEQTDIDEGLGSFLGKAAGHAVGGVKAAWRDAKQGYKDAKSAWDDPAGTGATDPAAAAAPAAGTAPAAAPGTAPAPQGAPAPTGDTGRPYVAPAPAGGAPAPAPAANPGAIGSIMQAVDKLDPESKKQLAGELEKSMAAPPPAAETPPAPGATSGTPGAGATPGTPEYNATQDHILANADDAKLAVLAASAKAPGMKEKAAAEIVKRQSSQQSKPADEKPAATTPPTSTAAPTTPPAGDKMTAAQQAALKAKLQGQRQAGKTTATQTGSGFKDYVGGSQNKLVTNPDGSTSMQKLQRESVEFRSNFLGMMI